MHSPLYIRLQGTAQRLITKYGQVGTIRRIAPRDPVTGGDGADGLSLPHVPGRL